MWRLLSATIATWTTTATTARITIRFRFFFGDGIIPDGVVTTRFSKTLTQFIRRLAAMAKTLAKLAHNPPFTRRNWNLASGRIRFLSQVRTGIIFSVKWGHIVMAIALAVAMFFVLWTGGIARHTRNTVGVGYPHLPNPTTATAAIPTTFSAGPVAAPTAPIAAASAPFPLMPTRGMVALSQRHPPFPDPVAGMPVLASRDEIVSAPGNLIRRIRVVKANFKYPLWRVEEILSVDRASGTEIPVGRSMMVADHVLVRLQQNIGVARLEALSTQCGAHIRAALHKPGCYLVSLPEAGPDTVPRLLAALNKDRTVVRYAEPDHILQAIQTLPDDPDLGSLWGLNNTGQSGGTPDADIDAPEAWDIATGNDDVVAAVIDTGVDYTHPDLVSNIWSNPLETVNGVDDDGNGYVDDVNGWDFVNNDNTPLDDYGHGTHVAGTIAAAGNNAVGVVGVNWRCRIMSLKFMDNSGSGVTSDAIDALNYASGLRRRGINVRLTNNSWGGGGEDALSDAIRESGDDGLLFVAAAGNLSSDNDRFPFYPASYPWSNIIAVAATDRRDTLAYFSQYGATSVDLAAPGVDILSTTFGGGYGTKSGTSMATPHVSGVAALLWSTWPDASWQDVRDAILKGVDPIPALAHITVTGGRLNAYKALLSLFRILHTPHPATYNTGVPYDIDATIGPTALIDTNALFLYWNSDGSTNFQSSRLSLVSNCLYRGSIPIQPVGSTIQYWLQATPRIGQPVTAPTNAPATLYSFRVVSPLGFIVSGDPDNYGTASPDYGWYTYPSGLVIHASVPLHTDPVDGARWKCVGWSGMGSVPPTGTSNETVFVLSRTSAIEWHWSPEYVLIQTASIGSLLSTATWWDAATTGMTVTAAATARQSGTNYAFAQWLLDGVRQPDTATTAANPVAGIVMNGPHAAEAVYMAVNLDADGDGMKDWWETYYFGSTNALPDADPDGDGFSNLDEFLDRTDPHRADSRPEPPVIVHTPLPDPRRVPAPCLVDALVTDNFAVASVTLVWSRSGGALHQTNMAAAATPDHYSAYIPAPGTNRDTFVYSIVAADARGATTTNGPHTFHIDYPLLRADPDSFDLLLPPNTTSNRSLDILNEGSANLHLTIGLLPAGFADTLESPSNAWSHSGTGDLWTLTTNRSVSGSHAWYCGNPATRQYASSMHARLDTPPIYLGAAAQLSFWSWIRSELDSQYQLGWLPNHAWDGGIVEMSTNAGVSFFQITPVNGYPRQISGWEKSPWPQNTPCFAGTGAWERVSFDLSRYATTTAIIRFHFGSDDNTQDEGWYLDDIAVTPTAGSMPWLSFNPLELDLPAGSQTNIAVTFSSMGIPTGNAEGAIQIASDAPNLPSAAFPARLRVRSPAVLLDFQAAQTSTQGEGIVTISNLVSDADGDVCMMDLAWSTNAGVNWASPALSVVRDSAGATTLVSSNIPPIANILTTAGTLPFTNLVTATWETSAAGDGIVLGTNTLIRARLWDGLAWSSWVTSQPFMVDNEAPERPLRLRSPTHLIQTWSSTPVMCVIWSPVSDGGGIGVADYLYGVSTNEFDSPVTGSTTNRVASSPSLSDGSNWWLSARTRDAFGNLSPVVRMGPYWIDSTPPSATSASLTLALSPFGRYVIGSTSVTGTWSGFTDSASGIEGYFVDFNNGAGTTNGQWTSATTGLITGARIGLTNTVYVWARDMAGNIGPAASAAYLVLDPAGDCDGDHLSNAQEEIAGTDACNPASAFKLAPSALDVGRAGGLVLQWPSSTNRLYTLLYRDSLLSETNWVPIPEFIQVPGVDGTMVYTDRTISLPVRFFRISVETP